MKQESNGGLAKCIKQLLASMFMQKVRNGILTDSKVSISIRLKKPEIVRITEGGKSINKIVPHFQFLDVNLLSSKPSCLETLIGFLYKAANEDNTDFFAKFPKLETDDMDVEKENPQPKSHKHNYPHTDENQDPYTGENQGQYGGQSGMGRVRFVHLGLDLANPNIPHSEQDSKLLQSFKKLKVKPIPMCRIPEIETVLQHAAYYFSGVFKIKTKYVKEYVLEEVNDEEICIKVYPQYFSEDDNRASQQMYKSEFQSIKKLLRVKDYHNIYIKHKEFRADVGGIVGTAILSKLIDNKLQLNEETYKQAKQQLQVIRKAGIIHGDVRKENLLYDNKVYVIDFSHARFNTYDAKIEPNYYELDSIFNKQKA